MEQSARVPRPRLPREKIPSTYPTKQQVIYIPRKLVRVREFEPLGYDLFIGGGTHLQKPSSARNVVNLMWQIQHGPLNRLSIPEFCEHFR